MSFGQKLKEIRSRFNISQEKMASLVNVSRQAITKWESDLGMPDIANLETISKTFNVSIDELLSENNLPKLVYQKKLHKTKYKNKVDAYSKVLKEYYSEPWEIYVLSVSKKLNIIEKVLDLFTGGDYNLIKDASDLSPYYLVKKDDTSLLVNIKDWTLFVIELPTNTNNKKFSYKENKFINCGKLKLR